MAILFKAMTRPAMFLGVPIVPLILAVGICFILGVYFTKLFWLAIPVAVFILRMIAKQDEHIFTLYFLKLKLLGKSVTNRFFNARAFLSSPYEPVNIDEFIHAMKLNDRITLDNYIPYSSHVDAHIIKTVDGRYVSTFVLLGMAFDTVAETQLALVDAQLANLLRSFSGEPLTYMLHTLRESFYDEFTTKSGNYYADLVAGRYWEGVKKQKFKANHLYFSVIYEPENKLDRAANKKISIKEKKNKIERQIFRMNEILTALKGGLEKFHYHQLGLEEKECALFSSQLAFYQFLLTFQHQPVRVTNTPFYQVLGGADIFFNNDTGQIQRGHQSKFFKSIEIKDFCSETTTGMLDALQYSEADYLISQSFSLLDKTKTLEAIRRTEKQLASTEDDAVSQLEELLLFKDRVVAGQLIGGMYCFTCVVFADSLAELHVQTSKMMAELTDLGFIVTLSTLSLPAAYFSQLPSVLKYRPRVSLISNQNFVELASLHNFFQGKRDHNCWGEAVTTLRTPSQQAYYMNFHNGLLFKDEVGEKHLANTKIIGTAGSGKTATVDYLLLMAQKFNNPATFDPKAKTKKLTCVFFDKDRGAELFIRMLGGEYYQVKIGEPTGWNPFALENTKRNRNFITQLIQMLCTRDGEKLQTREKRQISDVVDAVMALPDELHQYGITRMLEHLTQGNTREEQENGIIIRLEQWAQGSPYGWVFDNAHDTFNIDHVTNFGIDGTEFLDEAFICQPIAFYLLYRVTQLLDGRRLIIVMDEFWKWLQDEAFTDFVYNKLKTIRKLNGMVIPATQSPDEILKNKIARAVVEICSTSIYLPNPDADYDDYVNGFKLTPEEFEMVKSLDPLSRQALVKKSMLKKGDTRSFSTLVSFDLSGIGEYMKLLSASADNLEIFDNLYQAGMKPNEWVPEFLAKAV